MFMLLLLIFLYKFSWWKLYEKTRFKIFCFLTPTLILKIMFWLNFKFKVTSFQLQKHLLIVQLLSFSACFYLCFFHGITYPNIFEFKSKKGFPILDFPEVFYLYFYNCHFNTLSRTDTWWQVLNVKLVLSIITHKLFLIVTT